MQTLTTVPGQPYHLAFNLGTEQSAASPATHGPVSVVARPEARHCLSRSIPVALARNGASSDSILLRPAAALRSASSGRSRRAALILALILSP